MEKKEVRRKMRKMEYCNRHPWTKKRGMPGEDAGGKVKQERQPAASKLLKRKIFLTEEVSTPLGKGLEKKKRGIQERSRVRFTPQGGEERIKGGGRFSGFRYTAKGIKKGWKEM